MLTTALLVRSVAAVVVEVAEGLLGDAPGGGAAGHQTGGAAVGRGAGGLGPRRGGGGPHRGQRLWSKAVADTV